MNIDDINCRIQAAKLGNALGIHSIYNTDLLNYLKTI